MIKQCHIPRDVVRLLGTFSIIGLAGIIGLSAFAKTIPEGLLTLVAGAVGGLGSILASTRAENGAQNVQVVNPASDPVKTEDV